MPPGRQGCGAERRYQVHDASVGQSFGALPGEAEWRLFRHALQQGSGWVTWAKKLVEMIAEPGRLTPGGRHRHRHRTTGHGTASCIAGDVAHQVSLTFVELLIPFLTLIA